MALETAPIEAMNKQAILSEIRRTAESNGGVPLGMERFAQETGSKPSDWRGKIWVRWGDALREAGFEPNQMRGAYQDNVLIDKSIALMLELSHFPTVAEIRFKAHNDPGFPWHNTFRDRLGTRQQCAARFWIAAMGALSMPM
jgi:hypothetical protein